jgi:hypothetical protein
MRAKFKVKKNSSRALKELEKLGRSMSGPDIVKVGLPVNSNPYPDGTSVIAVGAIHEFGSPEMNIPERSYLRTTLNENRKTYVKFLNKVAKKIVSGEIDMEKALGLMGLKAQSDIRQKITDIKEPPLVIRIGGNPLVDTGHLRQSINYQIGE